MAIARPRFPGSPFVGRRMTLEAFLKLPEEKPYLELHEGVVKQKAAPQEGHSFLELGLLELINGFGRRRKLAVALPALRCYLGDSYLVPDVAIYRWDRLLRTPDGRIQNAYAGPPDVAIEILSPGQTLSEFVDKCLFYVAHGVPIVLLVHPRRDWIRVFRADGSDDTLRGDDHIDLESVLPGFELTARMVFQTLTD